MTPRTPQTDADAVMESLGPEFEYPQPRLARQIVNNLRILGYVVVREDEAPEPVEPKDGVCCRHGVVHRWEDEARALPEKPPAPPWDLLRRLVAVIDAASIVWRDPVPADAIHAIHDAKQALADRAGREAGA